MPESTHNTPIKRFERVAEKVSDIVGSPYWFFFSVMLVILWIPSGFLVGWGELWQLIINTATTILTFLMMSLLHASQGRWERKMEKDQEKEKAALKRLVAEVIKEEETAALVKNTETINSLK